MLYGCPEEAEPTVKRPTLSVFWTMSAWLLPLWLLAVVMVLSHVLICTFLLPL